MQLKKNIKLLLIQLGDIGDVVLTEPAMRAFKENFPSGKLVVCVRDKAKELVENCMPADDVISIDKKKRTLKAEIRYQTTFFQGIRNRRFDVAVDLRTGTRGAILSFLSGAPTRIGRFSADDTIWRNRLFTQLIDPGNERNQYAARHNLNIMAPLNMRISSIIPHLHVNQVMRNQALNLLKTCGIPDGLPIVAIHPFSLWRYKEWQIEQWSALIDNVSRRYPLSIIVTGAPDERQRAETLLNRCNANVSNLAGKTPINLLPALLSLCRLIIGVDTAALHIAAAVGTPTVGIFGPSNPDCWASPGKQHRIVQNNMNCLPCLRKGCENSESSRCLDTLPFRDVLKKVDEQLIDMRPTSPGLGLKYHYELRAG